MTRYDELLAFRFPAVEQSYSRRDTILYALGVGADELDYVYEDGLAALPSMAVTLAYPGFWYRDLAPGLDFLRTVHASERFVIHRPLPVAATVVATPRIVALHDKGEGRGALVVSEREIHEKQSGARLATVTQTAFCRGDGGLGGPQLASQAPHALPDRGADVTVEIATDRRAAMIYRLSGDDNPLHIDPDFAKRAGFDGPILHGLSTYGHAARGIVAVFAQGRADALRMMDCRFTAPVYPGEALVLDLWRDKTRISFCAKVGDRRVIDNGVAEVIS